MTDDPKKQLHLQLQNAKRAMRKMEARLSNFEDQNKRFANTLRGFLSELNPEPPDLRMMAVKDAAKVIVDNPEDVAYMVLRSVGTDRFEKICETFRNVWDEHGSHQ